MIEELNFLFIGCRVVSAATGSFLFGYALAAPNGALARAAVDLGWTAGEEGFAGSRARVLSNTVNALMYLGAVVGSQWAALLVQRGRRRALQISSLVFILGALLPAAPVCGTFLLCASRLATGVGVGVATVAVPLYIAEMAPARYRGFFGAFHQGGIGLGVLAAAALNGCFTPGPGVTAFDRLWWRFVFAAPALVALLALLSFKFLCREETPHFAVMRNDVATAVAVLRQGHTKEAAELALFEIVQAARSSARAAAARVAAAVAAAGARQGPGQPPDGGPWLPGDRWFGGRTGGCGAGWSAARGGARDAASGGASAASLLRDLSHLFSAKIYRRPLMVGLVLAVANQASGINLVISLSSGLFAAAGASALEAARLTVALAVAGALASCAAGVLIERWGRRPLLLLGSLGISACLFIASLMGGTAFERLALAAAFTSANVCYSSTVGPTVWIYLSEIYPLEIRSAALSACAVANWVTCSAVIFLGGFFASPQAAARCFAISAFASTLFIALTVLETKGSSIEDSPMSPRSLHQSLLASPDSATASVL